MNNKTYLKWNQLHNNLALRKKLPDTIFSSWEKSYSLGIDPVESIPPLSSEDEFNSNKENWKFLYYYANDILTTTAKSFDESNFGLALFDKTGRLIKLYGNDEFLKWAKENNLEKRALWDENIIGTNAVSLGLRLKKSVAVIGEEHFSKFAINFAIYFSPIMVQSNINDIPESFRDISPYGGIAVIVPVKNKNSSFLITADTFSRTIALQYLWFGSIHLFVNSADGYVVVDQSNNKNKIIFINKQIFNFFKTPYKDMYYKNLEDIIDAYPENKEFWSIINNKTKVQDLDMKLFVHGAQMKINLSVRPFYGKDFHIEGVTIVINSRERIQNLISKHTGNNATFTFSQIIGKNEKYLNILNQAKAAAMSAVNILLLGESGVGKDIIAQSIHNASDRSDKPFIAVNCASFPKDLISSELFGYEDGAFTGSRKGGNIGKFELANHGTIFLDEIGDMPLDLQAILLRVLEQKSFMKIGSSTSTEINVRIIAATNNNLREKIQKGEFREDLYYRLGIIKLIIPPLRHRKDDILLLAENFIEKICKRVNKPSVTLSPEVRNFFMSHRWPGNVRELQNLLEGVIQIFNSPTITYDHISNYILEDHLIEKNTIDELPSEDDSSELTQSNQNFEPTSIKSIIPNTKEYIIHALELHKYNKTNTAKYLGISRKTLYSRLREYDLL